MEFTSGSRSGYILPLCQLCTVKLSIAVHKILSVPFSYCNRRCILLNSVLDDTKSHRGNLWHDVRKKRIIDWIIQDKSSPGQHRQPSLPPFIPVVRGDFSERQGEVPQIFKKNAGRKMVRIVTLSLYQLKDRSCRFNNHPGRFWIIDAAIISTFPQVHRIGKMLKHAGIQQSLINQQGFDRIFQAAVALFPVPLSQDEGPQGMK